jgi:hypothetical protein
MLLWQLVLLALLAVVVGFLVGRAVRKRRAARAEKRETVTGRAKDAAKRAARRGLRWLWSG